MVEVEQVRQRSGGAHTGHSGRAQRAVGVVADPSPLAVHDPQHPYLVAMYDGTAG